MAASNRIALVTGAGTGIGRCTAIALLREGFCVVLAGRREAPLLETISEADDLGGNARAIVADVTSESSVENLFSKIESEFGRLDLLFNNAGINIPGAPIDLIPVDDWRRAIETNVTGVFLCTQQAVRLMKKQTPKGGRIINNGSISAQVPRPGSTAYTAAKHAVTGITKSTNLDCRSDNIACGQIDIGNADTSMASGTKKGLPQADGSVATEPTMQPEHVANTIVYLANLPLVVNVPFVTIMANQMPYIGRG